MVRPRKYCTKEEEYKADKLANKKSYRKHSERRKRQAVIYRKKHPEVVAAYNKKWKDIRESRKNHFIKLKGDKCAVCNNTYESVCYDFHHINPKNRDGSIYWHRSMEYLNKNATPNRTSPIPILLSQYSLLRIFAGNSKDFLLVWDRCGGNFTGLGGAPAFSRSGAFGG